MSLSSRLWPKHRASRRVAAVWLLVCVTTLIVLLVRLISHDGDRSALSALVPLYWLSLPLGHVGVLAVIDLKTALYLSGSAPGTAAEGLMSWLLLGLFGYAQWFVLLPFVARKCQQLLQYLFNRDATKSGSAR
jgi:hypothetical protein